MSVDLDAIHAGLLPASQTVRMLVSDMDGTILTSDKQLTRATLESAAALRQAGIVLCLASARTPSTMLRYIHELGLDTACAGFNGGAVFTPDGTFILSRSLSASAVRSACDMLHVHGVETWICSEHEWFVNDLASGFVERERRIVGGNPVQVADFRTLKVPVSKIIAVGNDYELLARMDTELAVLLEGEASVHRSSESLLDITPALANKGEAVRVLAEAQGIPLSEVACIGDSYNDLPMLSVAGLGIAMGQASDRVRANAHFVTDTNESEGWARAISSFILPRAPGVGERS